MARIAGVDLRLDKRVEIALTDIYGIGVARSNQILATAKVDPSTRVKAAPRTSILSPVWACRAIVCVPNLRRTTWQQFYRRDTSRLVR